MHQKKPETQIGKESRGISSDLNPISPVLSPPIHQKQFQIQSQSHSHSHSHIQSNPHQSTSHFFPNQFQPHPNQNQFQHEPISNNSSKGKTLHSTPHKRPIMIQSPSSLSHSPSLSSVNHYNHKTLGIQSSSQSCSCFTAAYLISLSQKLLALKVFRAHYHFVILLSLPSLYYFVSSPSRCFILDFLALLAFLAALLISLNLALPRLPSIRLFFARSFPIKLCSSSYASKPSHPVTWSIGSKPKSVKKPNSGSWEQVYRNGDVYEGEFHKGKCSGSGVYYYHMSGRYEGDWIDEKYDGYGVETWAKGSRYRGQYRQGLRHGIGVYRFYTGDVYAGEWSNGQCHGSGVYTCQDGSHYVGEFKWGVKHGLGHYHFRNGDTYAGEYFADKMHGFGVYQFGNGHRYEGAWHEGRRQGLGMYTFRNGETQSGHWQNGVLDVPCVQLTHPESPYAVNYTKVLNAVKEAQKAAEKAFNAGKVDERVKKAVAAANKAANAARVAAVKAVQNQMRLSNNDDGTPIPSV